MIRRQVSIAVTVLCLSAIFAGTAGAAESEEAQFNVVVSLYNAGQWEAALKKIDERQKQELSAEMRARYLYVRGLAHEKGNQADQAHAAYTALLKDFASAPEAPKARFALVYLDYAKGNNDAVAAACQQINIGQLEAAQRPNVSMMYAEALLATGKLPEAAAAYEAALSHGADRNVVAPKLFSLYLRGGDHAKLLAASAQGVPGLDAALVALSRAEALLALNKAAEAEAESRKVPADHARYPRACYALARALIALKRFKEAVEPLGVAIQRMSDPPAPLTARLALAECLLADGKTAEAEAALQEARRRAAGAPGPDQDALRGPLAMIEVRLAAESRDQKRLVKAIDEARGAIAPADLPKVLLVRLCALDEQKDTAAILRTMKDDYPILKQGSEDAQATLIYCRALEADKRPQEATALLNELVQRRPQAPEALYARLQLANAALSGQDGAAARAHYAAIAASPDAAKVLGADAVHDVLCNIGLIAIKANDADGAIQSLERLTRENPRAAVQVSALTLLGQARAIKKDYAAAAAAWDKALAQAPDDKKADLCDRIARAKALGGDPAGAAAQWDRLAGLPGGAQAVPAESLQAWAGALYSLKQYDQAAAKYQALYERHGNGASHAYECAAALEAAGKLAEAADWYDKAAQHREKLPPAYAGTIDACRAGARLRSATGDMGRDYWLSRLGPQTPDAEFDKAVGAAIAIADAGKIDDATAQKLGAATAAYEPASPRRYALGAAMAAALDAAKKDQALAELTAKLLEAWAQNESKLKAGPFGTTVAPAMIHYYAGEAARRAGKQADALVFYETVLSVYPYNEWPDAAALGAAKCFIGFGDVATAITRLREIVAAAEKSSSSQRWHREAAALLAELQKKGP